MAISPGFLKDHAAYRANVMLVCDCKTLCASDCKYECASDFFFFKYMYMFLSKLGWTDT